MKRFYAVLFVFLFIATAFGQAIPDGPYLGQMPPEKTPVKFAPGIISVTGSEDVYVSFSRDGAEMIYAKFINTGGWDGYYVHQYSRIIDNQWQTFEEFPLPEGWETPFFSLGSDIVISYSSGGIGYLEKSEGQWSLAHEFADFNALSNLSFPSVTIDNHFFFKFRDDENDINMIYTSKFEDGAYKTPEPLPFPINYNSEFYALNDPCVSYDGNYVLFVNGSSRRILLYVSFKKNQDQWTYPKSLSKYISNPNNIYFGLWPNVTSDGKYLFAWGDTGNNDVDIYWISTSVIEDARNSNFAPYISAEISDTTISVGKEYNFKIPSSTFFDDDGDTLTYSVTRGTAYWLNVDRENLMLSGIPTETGEATVRITAKDPEGERARASFKIFVQEDETTVHALKDGPTKFTLFQNFPNPFNPKTTINYSLNQNSHVQLTIYNIQGKEVRRLVDTMQSAGNYSVSWDSKDNAGKFVSSGMYFYELEGNHLKLFKKMTLIR